MTVTIYHNPRCSKSRQTLALLQEHGHDPEIVEYFKTPLTVAALKRLQSELGYSSVRDMMRTKEQIYRDQNLKSETSENALRQAILAEPKLLERPIVSFGGKAAMGRPPEAVLDLF